MLRNTVLACLALLLAILGGLSSADFMIRNRGWGAMRIGPWETFPDTGTASANPYSRARTARMGTLTLGDGEGIKFEARTDSAGVVLDRRCTYQLAGDIPAARLWTLVVWADGQPISVPAPGLFAERPGSRAISISLGRGFPGADRIVVDGAGPMQIAFNFYDTAFAVKAGTEHLRMPSIERIACND